MGRVISNLLWFGAMLGVVLGTLLMIDGFLSDQTAPQQGARAAMAVALAVLPYIAARAADAIRRNESDPSRSRQAASSSPAPPTVHTRSAKEIAAIRGRARFALIAAGVLCLVAAALGGWAYFLLNAPDGTSRAQFSLANRLGGIVGIVLVLALIPGFYGLVRTVQFRGR
jgi:hypothetical protein